MPISGDVFRQTIASLKRDHILLSMDQLSNTAYISEIIRWKFRNGSKLSKWINFHMHQITRQKKLQYIPFLCKKGKVFFFFKFFIWMEKLASLDWEGLTWSILFDVVVQSTFTNELAWAAIFRNSKQFGILFSFSWKIRKKKKSRQMKVQ